MPAQNSSLRWRLILILSVSAVLIWLVSTAVAWFQVRKEVNEVFDAQQILFAQRLASSDLRLILSERPRGKGKPHFKKIKKADFDDDALAFAVFTASGDMLLSDGRNGSNFIFTPKTGFSVGQIFDDDDDWRIFWQPAADGRIVIAVGQELEYRAELVNKMIFGQMWIWFASLPLLLGMLGFLISKELRVLKQISRQVQQRRPEEIEPLSCQRVPTEILPLIENLNAFFDRTSAQLLRERRFTSDAAHELRSPLAALRIQAEIAQIAGDDHRMREQALANLTQGIDRAGQLIEQLLTLSRLDNLTLLKPLEPLDWAAIIPSLIGELYFAADKRQMTLRFEQQGSPLPHQGQPLLASLMVRNLIDNAIKYCPTGATINVILKADEISVEDNGNGVSQADLAKLGQRFYRPAGQNEKGSGLGLSITQRIAELHHYRLRLENLTQQNRIIGFRASILFS